jgi:hypothetical protein
MFFNRFYMLVLKIKIYIILIIFRAENTLKNNYYYISKYPIIFYNSIYQPEN